MSATRASSALGREYWDFWDYPQAIFKQKFGSALDEGQLFDQRFRSSSPLHQEFLSKHSSFFRNGLLNSGASIVKNDAMKFQVLLDVSQFMPDEIDVKTVNNEVLVHAKHEERADDHGFITREFTRRYVLPVGADPEKVTCFVDSNGTLAIRVPKEEERQEPVKERIIPIAMTSVEKTKTTSRTTSLTEEKRTSKQSDV